MNEALVQDSNQEALMDAIEQARQTSQKVPGAYSTPSAGRDHFSNSDTMQMPSSGGESKITVHQKEDKETVTTDVRGETQTEPKNGSRSIYISTLSSTEYKQDMSKFNHGKVEVKRVDQNGESYSHVYKSKAMAQKVGTIIANGITERALEVQEHNRRLA